ncbi:hypothetical protein LWI29_003580 [Acer saccharum]|uniref:Uncharacterized protein n=1 Tax=Acer saccharum TaxID=4024 RepID=A0AA39W0S2_ACESA|nr:hypothetical protein LWI29_003580 [Acer saccharum]
MAEDLAIDLEELRQFHSIAKRLSKEAGLSAPATVSQSPTPITTAAKVPYTPALSYVMVASFSWDQDNEKGLCPEIGEQEKLYFLQAFLQRQRI